jgi:hypothetical protein
VVGIRLELGQQGRVAIILDNDGVRRDQAMRCLGRVPLFERLQHVAENFAAPDLVDQRAAAVNDFPHCAACGICG